MQELLKGSPPGGSFRPISAYEVAERLQLYKIEAQERAQANSRR